MMANQLERPRAVFRSDGSAVVSLPTGEVASIRRDTEDHSKWWWSLADSDEPDRCCYSQRLAYESACEASARRMMRPATVAGFSAEQARALEKADRGVYTKKLKALLVASTGHRGFSVRGSTGTAYSWIDVRGTDARGRLWLAAIFGDSQPSIPPTSGYRAWFAARAAGLSGESIDRAEHGWD